MGDKSLITKSQLILHGERIIAKFLKKGEALPIEGGTLKGKNLYFNNGGARVMGDTNRLQMESYNVAGDTNNRRILHLRNSTHSESGIADALALYDVVDGSQTIYKLYGEHNPPPGGGGGVPIAIAESSDGITYTATVDGINALSAGQLVVFLSSKVSASTAPTLDVNGLGAKTIKRRLSGMSSTTASGLVNNWLFANKPQLLMYDGTYWIAINQDKPMADDLYGSVSGEKVSYDNTTSGMTATTMQAAIDELYSMIGSIASALDSINGEVV